MVRPAERALQEEQEMKNWLGVFLLIIFVAVVNLIIAFFVFRALASAVGVPPEVNTPRRALLSLVTILPVAGVAGVPFFILPFFGPLLGTLVSAFVAPMMLAEKYELTQGVAAKIIIPTVVLIYIVTGVILYYGIPML
jgi:hypothetical protein